MALARRIFCFLKHKIVLVVLISIVLTVLVLSGANSTLHMTNANEFCTSCHSMQIVFDEYKESIHFKNTAGVRALCSDCHVPKPLGPKLLAKVLAAKDVMHELLGTIDTEQKFEAERWKMANRVWDKMKKTDSRECKVCHSFSAMELDEQDNIARKKHIGAVDKQQTCIDCHRGIAHEEPIAPDES